MACYVYGHLAQHFASAQADGRGKLHQMNKDLNRRLVKSLRDSPNILEVYSPPRVTKKAEKNGFTAGGALDLSTGWDFCKPSHQKAALRLVNELQPVLVVLSPPCTTFSALRNLSNFFRTSEERYLVDDHRTATTTTRRWCPRSCGGPMQIWSEDVQRSPSFEADASAHQHRGACHSPTSTM